MSQISDDARKMSDYIIEHGWYQGGTTDPNSNAACLVGSYWATTSNMSQWWDENPSLKALAKLAEIRVSGIPSWNDHPERTKQEVLDMLENVAIKYDDDAMRSVGNDTV